MKEKILALLLAAFAGVRKDGLAQLAGALSLQATTDDEAKTLVEKLTTENVDAFVKDFRKDVDKEVSVANKTYEGTLKEKFNFVEKDPADPGKKTDPTKTDPNDLDAKLEAALQKHLKPLQDKIAGYETEGLKKTRLETLESKFKDLPATIKAQKLADAQLFITTMDETAYNEYLTRTDTDITALNQELANGGLSGQGKPMFGGKNADGVSAGVSEYIASKSTEKPALAGKEL